MTDRTRLGRSIDRFLLIEVGATTYALPARRVVHSMASGAGLTGTVPLSGISYPVLDLRELFRLPAINDECQVVFLNREGQRTALLVDTLVGFEEIDTEASLPLPWSFSGREASWFKVLIPRDGSLCVLLRLQGLMVTAAALETMVE